MAKLFQVTLSPFLPLTSNLGAALIGDLLGNTKDLPTLIIQRIELWE